MKDQIPIIVVIVLSYILGNKNLLLERKIERKHISFLQL
jgi:hypothetical protein